MKYYIPELALDKLTTMVKRLSKKTDVVFEVLKDDVRMNKVLVGNGIYSYYKEIAIELDIDYKVGDYEVVAELEHHEVGNIIRRVNNEVEIPESYKTCKPYCEHCNKIRNRNNTFLLLDKKMGFKQVGKTCLNDFTGINAQGLVADAFFVLNFVGRETWEDDEEFLNMVRNQRWFGIKEEANKIYQLVLKEGWNNKEGRALYNLDQYRYDKSLDDKVEEILNVVDTEWYKDNSEYCHNVKVMLSLDYIESKHFNLLGSFINSALNYLTSKDINNEYLGQVKDKVEFEIKSVKALYDKCFEYCFERYNVTTVYRVLTSNRNVVIVSTDKELKEGMIVKATIKKLSEYKGEKQTEVTRLSIVDNGVKEEPASVGLDKFIAYADSDEEINWDSL